MSLADQGSLYRQALKAAVADARLSAETLAAAAGRSLGKVTTVVEGGSSVPVPMAAKAMASDAGTPIEAGIAGDDRERHRHVRTELGKGARGWAATDRPPAGNSMGRARLRPPLRAAASALGHGGVRTSSSSC